MGGEWGPVIFQSFDNTLLGFLTLFEMSTTEGWLGVLYSMVDAVGPEMQPIAFHSPIWALFGVLWIIVGSFFIMNLFVAVVIDRFNRLKAENDGISALLTPEQQQWIKLQKMMMKVKPKKRLLRPERPCCNSCCRDSSFGVHEDPFVHGHTYDGQTTGRGN